MDEATRQLEGLLADERFQALMRLITYELTYKLKTTRDEASSLILSGIGEPSTLKTIEHAWRSVAMPEPNRMRLVRTIITRRVLDVFRRDARRSNHSSFLIDTDALTGPATIADSTPDARDTIEKKETILLVHHVLECFEQEGKVQARQAGLIRRYALGDATYAALSTELSVSPVALRVRVHKAIRALRRYIKDHHPEIAP